MVNFEKMNDLWQIHLRKNELLDLIFIEQQDNYLSYERDEFFLSMMQQK